MDGGASVTTQPADLVATCTRFCRALRARGVAVAPGEAIDAVRALAAIDVSDRRELYLALRNVLTTRPEDFPIFDELFDLFWAVPRGPASPGKASVQLRAPPMAESGQIALERWMRSDEPEPDEEAPLGIARASDRESSGGGDIQRYRDDALREVTRIARYLARRLAARPSRRWRAARSGPRLHLRRTVRQSLKTGGDISELVFRERKLRRTKLVVLCDVSGSMELYAQFLLQFLYALQHSFASVETFVFSTRLSRITPLLGPRRYREALLALHRDVHDWSGGTRIGASLASFVARWQRLVDRRTIVIVLSDGWDTGEPELLAGAMAAIRERAGRVIWLNPLLGSKSYQPLTRGMQAALPHVDVFAPVHDLASLAALARHLSL